MPNDLWTNNTQIDGSYGINTSKKERREAEGEFLVGYVWVEFC